MTKSDATTTTTTTTRPLDRTLHVINQSGERVSVEWLHPHSGKSIPLGAPTSGEETRFNTYVNHTFVVVRQGAASHTDDKDKNKDDGSNNNTSAAAASAGRTRTATIKITEDQVNQVFVIREGLAIEIAEEDNTDQRLREQQQQERQVQVNSATESCQVEARRALASLTRSDDTRSRQEQQQQQQMILEQLADCLTTTSAALFQSTNEQLAEEQHWRLELAAATENYTCADPTRETSKPIEIRTWTQLLPQQVEEKEGQEQEQPTTRMVHVLHSRPSSQIHLVHDFISPQECQAIQEAAAKTLHRGTVADGKGGSRLSESRKAWQAGLSPNWQAANQDPIAAVAQRILDYTNHVMPGYNLTHHGQEDLVSIQYFGSGNVHDPTPDRYMPHCDGDCHGLPHKTGGRVATMVLYCDVPEQGGGTNFQRANVFVQPKVGAAAFFSYYHAETGRMETGFTTHSGCPVYRGTKRIAVQWMRIGVDDENPWDSFDTNTVSVRRQNDNNDDDNENQNDSDDNADEEQQEEEGESCQA
ncbi:hypothetical protein ACA910_017907 [Epithemia clementina (nom. ined.)]